MAGALIPAIFVNEDISKPENRLNLALLGLMNVPRFREWFVQRLHLPEDSAIYPPQNVHQNLRPDFVVTSPPGEEVYGWIEVELGFENTAQLKNYRDNLKGRVISIVGSQDSECDLSLQEVAVEIEEWLPELNAQQKISADIMLILINQNPPKRAYYYDNPKSRIKNLPIMKQFDQYLGDILEFGIPPVPPGKVVITTNTQKGWSLRVFALGALGRSVSLMWAQSLGGGVIRVPSTERLLRCLPDAGEAIRDLSQMMHKLGFDINRIRSSQSHAVPEQTILAAMGSLAPLVRRLATADGAQLSPEV